MTGRRIGLLLVPLLLAAAAAGYMVSRQLAHGPQLEGGTALTPPRPVPAFMLTDQHGAAFDQTTLRGRPALLFFGFTHCPDVCPTTLALMAQLRRVDALRGLRPVFVTVDPQRDDLAALQRYAAVFADDFTALRGDADQLARLTRGLGVAHGTMPLAGGGYSVDHSAALFFINERGQWSAVFTAPHDFNRLRRDLTALVASGH